MTATCGTHWLALNLVLSEIEDYSTLEDLGVANTMMKSLRTIMISNSSHSINCNDCSSRG